MRKIRFLIFSAFLLVPFIFLLSCSNTIHSMIPSGNVSVSNLELWTEDEIASLSAEIEANKILVKIRSETSLASLFLKVQVAESSHAIPLTKEYIEKTFPSMEPLEIDKGYAHAKEKDCMGTWVHNLLLSGCDVAFPDLDEAIDFTESVLLMVLAQDGSFEVYEVSVEIDTDD